MLPQNEQNTVSVGHTTETLSIPMVSNCSWNI